MLRQFIIPLALITLSGCAADTVSVSPNTETQAATTVEDDGHAKRQPKFLEKPAPKKASTNKQPQKMAPMTTAEIKKLEADQEMFYTRACLKCRQSSNPEACLADKRCEEIENCTSMNIAKTQRGGPALSLSDRRSEAQMCKDQVLENGMSQ